MLSAKGRQDSVARAAKAQLVRRLREQSPENPQQIDVEAAIEAMREEQKGKRRL